MIYPVYFIRNTQEQTGQIIQQNSTFFTILRRTFENCSVAVALRRTFFATASQATHVAPTLTISADFELKKGEIIYIAVGQIGMTIEGGGGGGGTFVVKKPHGSDFSQAKEEDILLIAAGGAGSPCRVGGGDGGGTARRSPGRYRLIFEKNENRNFTTYF